MQFSSSSFIRVPTPLFETLLRLSLSGTQWRILLWTIRKTLGWNRATTRFSWYRIAKELSMDRSGVVRAGNHLVNEQVLIIENGRLGIRLEVFGWDEWCLGKSEDLGPRVTTIRDDGWHRNRGRQASLSRRAKDSSKDFESLNKHINNVVDVRSEDNLQRISATARNQHPAGAALPIPTKYDT